MKLEITCFVANKEKKEKERKMKGSKKERKGGRRVVSHISVAVRKRGLYLCLQFQRDKSHGGRGGGMAKSGQWVWQQKQEAECFHLEPQAEHTGNGAGL